jgi:DNA-binding transcriptional LysR family regulator
MDVRLLQSFLTLAEELHFGRAAVRSGISQPRLSTDIRKLERILGLQLFDRTSRRTALTAAGVAFEAGTKRSLAELEKGVATARLAAKGAQQAVTVGYVAAAMMMGLPSVVRSFRTRNPAAILTLRELSTVPQLELLAQGLIDIAITSTVTSERDIVCHGRWRDPLFIVLPDDDPRSLSGGENARALELGVLASDPFVLFPAARAPDHHAEILAACGKAGFVPKVVQEAEGWHSLLSLVAAGIGVTIAPSVVRRLRVPGVRLHPISGKGFATSVTLCTGRGPLSGATSSFLELADFSN